MTGQAGRAEFRRARVGGVSSVTCERARQILLDDLRPERQIAVSREEYAEFMWHMCWCPACVAYERALEPPWMP
jgi:hypothetical protein